MQAKNHNYTKVYLNTKCKLLLCAIFCYVHLLFTKQKYFPIVRKGTKGMEGKKIWNKREMFKFIARYEYYRELWDTKSVLYKNKLKRTKALHSLASEFQTNVGEISKKIRVLRSQFFQMYKKMYEDCDENGVASAFVTKWKYYRPLQFILVSKENNDMTDHSHPDEHMQKKNYDNIVSDDNDGDKAVLLIVQKQESMEKLHSRCNDAIIKCFDFEEHELKLANDQKIYHHHTKKLV